MSNSYSRFAKLAVGVATAGLLGLAGTAQAAIVGVSGAMVELNSAPSDVSVGALESNTEIRVFAERSGVMLGSDLTVDLVAPGTYDAFADVPSPSPLILAGQKVDSYLIHIDSNFANNIHLNGSVTFDQDVLGIFIYTSTLAGSDAQFGAPGTTYDAHVYRGLEGLDGPRSAAQDTLTVLSARELSVDFIASTAIDHVRVLTASPVPLPAPVFLLGSAGLALLGWRRTRRT